MTFKFWFAVVMVLLLVNGLWEYIPEGDRIWVIMAGACGIGGIGMYEIWGKGE